MKPRHDNLPKKPVIWLLFDIDNGDSSSKHYVWWFESRQQAREFKAHHLASPNPHKTELVGPVKATVDRIPPGALKGTRLAP
jgi:hypothetical protein